MDYLQPPSLSRAPSSDDIERIARLAAQIFGLQAAAISLTYRDHHWCSTLVNMNDQGVLRTRSTVAERCAATEITVIEDLTMDSTWASAALARAGHRFYARAPLLAGNTAVGALCVMGNAPHSAGKKEIAAFRDVAAMAAATLELQHALGRLDPISGLPTRAQFREDYAKLCERCPGET